MFITRIELLPEDETTDEHDAAKRAEALQIETDKSPGGEGLFGGAFKNTLGPGTRLLAGIVPIHDVEDGVDRCPICAWELEEGECNHCGFNEDEDDDFSDDEDEPRSLASIVNIDSDLDEDIDEEDHDLDIEIQYDSEYDHQIDRPRHRNHHTARQGRPIPTVSGHNHDEYDDDESSVMSDPDPRPLFRRFRTAHAFEEEESSVMSEASEQPLHQSAGAQPHEFSIVVDSGDDSTTETAIRDESSDDDDESISISEGDGLESDSDDESDIPAHISHRSHFQTSRDETPTAGEPRSPGSFYADAMAAGATGYGFSPLRDSSPATSDHTSLASPTPETDEPGEEARGQATHIESGVRTRGVMARRPARVVLSSDDESDGNTPTPPRPADDRRAHLQAQRARRGGAGNARTAQRHYRGR